MKMTVHFVITICGSGNTIDDAWQDATDGFSLEPGEYADYEIIEEEEE